MKALMLGGGGHARLLQHLTPNYTYAIIDKAKEEAALDAAPCAFMNGIGVKGADLSPRIAAYQRFKARGFIPLSFISRHALIEGEPELGQGTQLMAGVILQPFVKIGENAVINTGASIDHACDIGAHVFIAPRVTLCGGVTIGEGAFLGVGCVVFPGAKIKPYAVIKAMEIVR